MSPAPGTARRRAAPRLAIALLDRLDPGSDALAGDLLEEYATGRSTRWFWRQVLTAIVVRAGRDLRDHTLLAVRATVVGWVTLFLFLSVTGDLLTRRLFGEWMLDRLIALRYDAIAAGTDTFVMAWAIHLHHLPAALIGFLVSGWVVCRLHRSHAAATLFAFMLTVLLFFLCAAHLVWLTAGPRMIARPLRAVLFMGLPFLNWWAGMLLVPMLILLGGWCGTTARRTAASGAASGTTSAGDPTKPTPTPEEEVP